MKLASRISALTLIAALASGPFALAQAASKPASDAAAAKPVDAIRTFYLKNATQASDANEIVTAIRNSISPGDRVFLVPSQNAIVMRAPAEDFARVQQLLDDLDRPKKAYRLTYTITEMDGEKRVGTQHYSMVLANGQEAILKQGDRVPIATSGTVNSAMPGSTQAQFVYQDIGMSFGATLSELHEGARLRTDVVQTSLATEKPAFTAPDPVIRQTEFKGEAVLSAGKPLVLGSMDIPGSTRHFQIEALIEPLP